MLHEQLNASTPPPLLFLPRLPGPVERRGVGDPRSSRTADDNVIIAYTDADGTATESYAVSHQPGDNYRVVATLVPAGRLPALFDPRIHAAQDDGVLARVLDANDDELPTADARTVAARELLTVWRRLHVEVDSMGAVAGNTITGTITNVASRRGVSTVTTDQTLDDSVNRFENGWLTDSAGITFRVRSNSSGANFRMDVDNLPGAPGGPDVTPAAGDFSLVDDDLLKDGEDVPMPDTSTLAAAMAEAYVKVVFDVGDNNVPFDANVDMDPKIFGKSEDQSLIADNWSSRDSNSKEFWVAYVLGAFQGPTLLSKHQLVADNDPNSEQAVLGASPPKSGGSIIFLETNRDVTVERNPNLSPEQLAEKVRIKERDTVVHEVAHAVADNGKHPVTGADAQSDGVEIGKTSPAPDRIFVAHHNPSRYQPAYLDWIRSTKKPRS